MFSAGLAPFQDASHSQRRQWRRRIYEEVQEASKAESAVKRLCQAAGVSRAGYYRFLLRAETKPADMDLRNLIQRVVLQWPTSGYRRVQAELQRQGCCVNHKRVLRLMRADNFAVFTSRSPGSSTRSENGAPSAGGYGRFQGSAADLNPSLQMPSTGEAETFF
jgi:hypothetical protein